MQDEKEDEVVPGELQDFTLQVLQKKTCNKAYNVTLSSRYEFFNFTQIFNGYSELSMKYFSYITFNIDGE